MNIRDIYLSSSSSLINHDEDKRAIQYVFAFRLQEFEKKKLKERKVYRGSMKMLLNFRKFRNIIPYNVEMNDIVIIPISIIHLAWIHVWHKYRRRPIMHDDLN